jgi:hypothetical protein
MSVSTEVFLRSERMPIWQTLREGIVARGFALDLHVAFDMNHSGFLPCRYQGRDSGFEFVHPNRRCRRGRPRIPGRVFETYDGDLGVSMTTRAWSDDLQCATIVAGVLAELSGGRVRENGSGDCVKSDRALAWARALERELNAHG